MRCGGAVQAWLRPVGILLVCGAWLAGCAGPPPAGPTQAGRAQPAAATGGAASAPVTSAAPAPPPRLALTAAYTATASAMAPLWLAKEQGLLARQGLDVELMRIQPGPPVLAALQAGEVPFAVAGGASVVPAVLGGSDHVLVGGISTTLTGQIFTQPGLGTSPAELRGKRFAISRFGSTVDYGLRVGMRQLGLDAETDLIIVQAGGGPEQIAAMMAGGVDGSSFTPPETAEARRLGYPVLLDLGRQGIPYAGSTLVSTRGYLRDNPDVLERVGRALAEAIRVYDNDRPAAYAVLRQYGRIDDPTVIEDSYEVYYRNFARDLVPRLDGVQAILDQLSRDDPRAASARPEQFVDLTVANRLRDSGFLAQLGP